MHYGTFTLNCEKILKKKKVFNDLRQYKQNGGPKQPKCLSQVNLIRIA